MKSKYFLLFVFIFSISLLNSYSQEKETNSNDSLAVLWTSGDAEVFKKVVLPYCLNSKRQKWWNDVELIIWGPSSNITTNEDIMKSIKLLRDSGVRLKACKWCADQYQVSEHLKSIGVEVVYMGKPLTDYLKSDKKLITF